MPRRRSAHPNLRVIESRRPKGILAYVTGLYVGLTNGTRLGQLLPAMRALIAQGTGIQQYCQIGWVFFHHRIKRIKRKDSVSCNKCDEKANILRRKYREICKQNAKTWYFCDTFVILYVKHFQKYHSCNILCSRYLAKEKNDIVIEWYFLKKNKKLYQDFVHRWIVTSYRRKANLC